MMSKILQGRKGIADYLKIDPKTVDAMIADGMPVNKVNGRLFAHIDEIDRFFRSSTVPSNQAQYFQRLIYISEQILDEMKKLRQAD